MKADSNASCFAPTEVGWIEVDTVALCGGDMGNKAEARRGGSSTEETCAKKSGRNLKASFRASTRSP